MHQNKHVLPNGGGGGTGFKNGGRFSNPRKRVHFTVPPGHISFRLLCDVSIAGGLIGHSGSIVKKLEQDTSTKIRVEDALTPDSEERLVYVLGSEPIDRTMRLKTTKNASSSYSSADDNEGGEGEGEGGSLFHVSAAQEGLLRVFERILEVEAELASAGGGDGAVCCRLLAATDQIGALMGRGGKRIEKLRSESGAFIRVLQPEQLPPCADYPDELIQITGDTMSVKKALVAVSQCLQENPPMEKASAVLRDYASVGPEEASRYSDAELYPGHGSSLPRLETLGNHVSELYFPSKDGGRHPNTSGGTTAEVVFRILCSNDAAGGVIGKGGNIVKALQNETGASILFATPVAGCDERLVTVSALENMESYQSAAQNAIVHVFVRSTEAVIRNGLSSDRSKRNSVTARLIIPSNQAGCLIGPGGTIISDLQKKTGSVIRILEGNHVPYCASGIEKVVQIFGEYISVQNALLQVTSRLRENMFSQKGLNGVRGRSSPSFPVPNCSSSGRGKDDATIDLHQPLCPPTYVKETNTLASKMDDLKLSHGADGSLQPEFLPHQALLGGYRTAISGNQRDLTTFTGSTERGSKGKCATVTSTTLEIAVPRDICGSVCGQDGCNIARLREISGAKVVVHDLSSGTDGKFIISGTPNQTLAAQSLLQAFILNAK
ncbi:hypothetical protein Ancab_026217 [Ancistrocladus abbreviatus]